MFDESIVLLGCAFGKRLEPVCVVCHTVLVSPLLDALSYSVGYGTIQTSAVVDNVDELFINVARKILVHLGAVENVLTEELRWTFNRCNHVDGFLVESVGYNLESQICHCCFLSFMLFIFSFY